MNPGGAVVDPIDFLDLDALLSSDELSVRGEVRQFVDRRILPSVEEWYERVAFPRSLAQELGALGVLGMHLTGYGCPGRSAVEYGLACQELEAGDSGLRSFVSVQGSLAMYAIWKYGSESQKQEWLPAMAAGQRIGCFGLTEPSGGSDPSRMQTTARWDGQRWTLDGAKRWMTNGAIADIAVVWARTDEGIRGFLVPTGTPGFSVYEIRNKLSLRASISAGAVLTGVRVPAEAILPESSGLGSALSCLNEARFGVLWGAMGAGRSCYQCALDYAVSRVQFGKPIASFQMTQEKLVNMMVELNNGSLLALHLGRMKDRRRLTPERVSYGKLNNVRAALEIARHARAILGANGVTSDYPVMRHMNNLESVLTYEGTQEVQTLILGQAITGIPAFR